MAGRIRDEDIALVRERTAIADVISEQVTLKPAGGGNLKGLCPFHDEKTPSFTVAPARNVYFCHGCGTGGDAIKFIMDVDHLTFVESVERLAARAGIQLRYVEAGPAPAAGPEAAPGRGARRRRRVLRRADRHSRCAAGPRVPRHPRVRPSGRADVRLRVRARRVGPADQAPAGARLHRPGAAHRRAGPGGAVGLADRPLPAPAAVAHQGSFR
jgi:CHC2 zinc finger